MTKTGAQTHMRTCKDIVCLLCIHLTQGAHISLYNDKQKRQIEDCPVLLWLCDMQAGIFMPLKAKRASC
ncbi:hypothetical protein DUNSADRAFT_7711 [Dunaliella salina]|uniref:Encoded protein n=1 Tax=Dunaliella salina TaxID=3046 RepID=A0ABQ7GKT3_DUNSA|nr:hypothetical protein DUNSADRAFT_7711 [Dunaliella salina]|eukprot:KAF5835222.1 hypothetical protein DUNSADRAFT_7711 [Dunaliella salina]